MNVINNVNDISGAGLNEETPTQNYTLEFKTTAKNRKEYDYREHKWDLKNQLNVDDYLTNTSYSFIKGGHIEKNETKTC